MQRIILARIALILAMFDALPACKKGEIPGPGAWEVADELRRLCWDVEGYYGAPLPPNTIREFGLALTHFLDDYGQYVEQHVRDVMADLYARARAALG